MSSPQSTWPHGMHHRPDQGPRVAPTEQDGVSPGGPPPRPPWVSVADPPAAQTPPDAARPSRARVDPHIEHNGHRPVGRLHAPRPVSARVVGPAAEGADALSRIRHTSSRLRPCTASVRVIQSRREPPVEVVSCTRRSDRTVMGSSCEKALDGRRARGHPVTSIARPGTAGSSGPRECTIARARSARDQRPAYSARSSRRSRASTGRRCLAHGRAGQSSMLGRARPATLFEHEPEPAPVRDSPIGQPRQWT